MTKDERQELRQIQETLIAILARVTDMLGGSKALSDWDNDDSPAPKPKRAYTLAECDSEAKERFIAP